MNKLTGWDDTIVALSTPPGVSALAVIRVSGKQAFAVADTIFPAKKISEQGTHTAHVGLIAYNGETIDEAVLTIFRGPKSFTGEDTIEISCHGNPVIQQQVISACVAAGARPARAGEFTQRAFLNGKMDLTRAEAVADIILAETNAAKNNALQNIRGGFSRELNELREELIGFSALIELELDFATEDVEFADREKFRTLVEKLFAHVNALVDSFRLGNVIKNGISVAIIGRPNAGKSTLLNALLNEERAIVSAIAGTTRDTIEETLNINGILFRLIDTAGIREHTADTIETMGIERAYQNADRADLVLHVIDLTDAAPEAGIENYLREKNKKWLTVFNKADMDREGAKTQRENEIFVAAKTGEGITELKSKMFAAVSGEALKSEGTIVTNSRHLESLKQIAAALADIRTGLANNLTVDLLSSDIRTALYHLGDITGEVTTEDKLDFIFSKFCIGK